MDEVKETQRSLFAISRWNIKTGVQSRASIEGSKEDLIESLCEVFSSSENGHIVLNLVQAAIHHFYNNQNNIHGNTNQNS